MADAPALQLHEQLAREAEVVSRHLPEGYSAGPEVVTSGTNEQASAAAASASDAPESSLQLQGGDIHRDMFRIQAKPKQLRRTATFAHPTVPPPDDFPLPDHAIPAGEQQTPGGFRRQFLIQRRPSIFQDVTRPITDNFISFLDLYGSFAGEDLAESDEDESAIEEEEEEVPGERRPLLHPRRSTKRSIRPQGQAGMTKSFFTLLKAFIGTGIMFLPKAFRNGGILFSSLTLIAVSLVSTLCFHLLLSCRRAVQRPGYGEIGEAVFGPRFKTLILFSIFISQLGFVCAGIIFTAENAGAVLTALSGPPLSTTTLILLQLTVLIPLALIRHIGKLGPAALVADAFILLGLAYIYTYTIHALRTQGPSPTVTLFNPTSYPLTLGSAIFTFEGIGLILPIQSSMAAPHRFPALLLAVMLLITCIFTAVGALCYAVFGTATRVEVISNFPQDSPLVNAVQLLYALAVLLGTPVQLFPALRIAETRLFPASAYGKLDPAVKWRKNAFRAALISFCALVAVLGAADLDKFVALIGALACVPLVYVYPPLLHWKAVARKPWEKVGDAMVVGLGVLAMGFSAGMVGREWLGW